MPMRHVPFSGIKKIEEIAKSSNEYISLSQGAIKLGGIPKNIKHYVQTLLEKDTTDYYESCWGLRSLREKLAQRLSEQYNTVLTADYILPTHGCIGGLSLLYLSLLGPGDQVIIPQPAYPAYETLASVSQAQPVFVSCLNMKNDGSFSWELSIEKIKQAVTNKTKIIIFSNPWNPLGIIVPQKTITELLTFCEEKGIYLIIDEAYRDYAFIDDYQSTIPLVSKSDFLISAHSFSKNMAMSGWRIGFLVVPEKLTPVLAGMQDALLNCLNNTAQFAAMFALDHPEISQQFHTIVKDSRDFAIQKLQPLVEKNIFSFTKPYGSFFLFLKTEHNDATDLCISILNQTKVALVPGLSFGLSGASFIRLCYAREKDVIEAGINRLINYFT